MIINKTQRKSFDNVIGVAIGWVNSIAIWSINPGLTCYRCSSADNNRNELEESDSPDDDNDGDAHNYDFEDVFSL